jgi:high-affinity K+ transport system ATPase subunit B
MISIADLQDKSCSQSHIPLFIIAHSGSESRHKLKCSAELLAAIEDFGSVTILCSDKTGTLTEGEIVLDRHEDVRGRRMTTFCGTSI